MLSNESRADEEKGVTRMGLADQRSGLEDDKTRRLPPLSPSGTEGVVSLEFYRRAQNTVFHPWILDEILDPGINFPRYILAATEPH